MAIEKSKHTAELVRRYAKKYGVSLADARESIARTFEVVKDELNADNDVTVYKFGKFKRIDVPEKATRQPGTDHFTVKPAHRLIHFRISNKF